jgi:hypothetical protein
VRNGRIVTWHTFVELVILAACTSDDDPTPTPDATESPDVNRERPTSGDTHTTTHRDTRQ